MQESIIRFFRKLTLERTDTLKSLYSKSVLSSRSLRASADDSKTSTISGFPDNIHAFIRFEYDHCKREDIELAFLQLLGGYRLGSDRAFLLELDHPRFGVGNGLVDRQFNPVKSMFLISETSVMLENISTPGLVLTALASPDTSLRYSFFSESGM